MSCSLAGLHAGTFGRERVFSMLRGQLPGSMPGRGEEQDQWRGKVGAALEALKPGLAGDLGPVLQCLAGEMLDPGEFLCLTHGDWTASSVWYGDSGPRLLDFRNGSYRHALQDLSAWEWRCGVDSPAAVSLWREYKGELERLGADRGDRFGQAHARARAWVALHHLAQGERSTAVQSLLDLAADGDGLDSLKRVAEIL
jgi:hypothetical protein